MRLTDEQQQEWADYAQGRADNLRDRAEEQRDAGDPDDLATMYDDDAVDAQKVADLLYAGKVKKALEAIADLDTNIRDWYTSTFDPPWYDVLKDLQGPGRKRRAVASPELLGAGPYERAMETIQEHRRQIGQSLLDPQDAGWSEGDVMAEAARIAKLNPGALERLKRRLMR